MSVSTRDEKKALLRLGPVKSDPNPILRWQEIPESLLKPLFFFSVVEAPRSSSLSCRPLRSSPIPSPARTPAPRRPPPWTPPCLEATPRSGWPSRCSRRRSETWKSGRYLMTCFFCRHRVLTFTCFLLYFAISKLSLSLLIN